MIYTNYSTMSLFNHHCKYCREFFEFKEGYESHLQMCAFYNGPKFEKERNLDSVKKLPSPQSQHLLVQYLFNKVEKLEKDVLRLKGMSVTRKRRVILEWLQRPDRPKPNLPFHEWSKTIAISYDHLNEVFEGDITDGMKRTLTDVFSYSGPFPICSFTQKAATIYIWNTTEEDDDPRWMIMTQRDFARFISRLSHSILVTFLKWQQDNAHMIRSNELNKERNIQYMRKINGLGQRHEERRQTELKQWIFKHIARDFEHDIEYDYM